MSHSLELKNEAAILRRKGYSLNEISTKLKISRSTASLWLRDIALNAKAQKRLKKRKKLGYYKTSLRWRKKRLKKQRIYEQEASELTNKVENNKLHARIYCCLLFWCEGTKDKTAKSLVFSNSDPQMIETFLSLLRAGYDIDESKLRALIHLHNYHVEKKQIGFWSSITKIPASQFYKSYQKANTGKRIRKNYPGCISIRYNDVRLYNQIIALYRVFSKIHRGVG